MNSVTANFYGCIAIMVFVAIIAAVLVGGGAYLAHEATAWHASDNGVEIIHIGAQRDITLGCMEHSWFTSMHSCIQYGGVNGSGWNWFDLMMVTAGLVVVWKAVTQ